MCAGSAIQVSKSWLPLRVSFPSTPSVPSITSSQPQPNSLDPEAADERLAVDAP
jgi:hypothetical protein